MRICFSKSARRGPRQRWRVNAMSWLLLQNRIRQVRNMGRKLTPGQKAVAAILHSIFLMFAIFLIGLFYLVFKALNNDQAGLSVISYLIDQMFFLIFVLTIISGAISALYLIFHNHEINFLSGLPLPATDVFNYLLLQNIIINSWPVVIIGTPLTIGYALAMHLSIEASALTVAAIVPFVLLAEALGIFLALGLSSFYRKLRTRAATALMLVLGTFTAFYLAGDLTPTRLSQLLIKPIKGGDLVSIRNSRITSPWLPNYWIARIYGLALTSAYARMFFSLAVLAVAAAVMTAAAVRIGGRLHRRVWLLAQETPERKRTGYRRAFPRILPGPKGALIERDYLVFSRNVNEVYQAFFIFMLVLLFVFIVSKIPYLNLDLAIWRYRLSVFIFGAVSYLLAMIANRFVFPSLSIEGRNFWILISSPLDLRQLYWAKFASSLTILSILGTSLLTVTAYFYRMNLSLTLVMLIWVLATSAAVSAIALGMGVLFPDFTKRSAAEMSSSAASLISTIVSLAYGGLGMWLLAPMAAGFYLDRQSAILLPTAAYLSVSLLVFAYLSASALSRLKTFRL